jgi:hypothetical protein
MRPRISILTILAAFCFSAQAADEKPAAKTDHQMNRWIEASDFIGSTSRFSIPLKLDQKETNKDFGGYELSKVLASADGQTSCKISKYYPEGAIPPSSVSITSRQKWRAISVAGPIGLDPDNKAEALSDTEKARLIGKKAVAACNEQLQKGDFPRPVYEICALFRINKEMPLGKIGDAEFQWTQKGVDFLMRASAEELKFLDRSKKNLDFFLQGKNGEGLHVDCSFKKHDVSFSDKPELIVAQYHSLLTAAGIVLEKDGAPLKPFVTNSEERILRDKANQNRRELQRFESKVSPRTAKSAK